MTREEQIRFIEEADQRAQAHVARVVTTPEFIALLNSYDPTRSPARKRTAGQR